MKHSNKEIGKLRKFNPKLTPEEIKENEEEEAKIAAQQKELGISKGLNTLRQYVRELVWLDRQISTRESKIADAGAFGGKRPIELLPSDLDIRLTELLGPVGPIENLRAMGVSDEVISFEIRRTINGVSKSFMNSVLNCTDADSGIINLMMLKEELY